MDYYQTKPENIMQSQQIQTNQNKKKKVSAVSCSHVNNKVYMLLKTSSENSIILTIELNQKGKKLPKMVAITLL